VTTVATSFQKYLPDVACVKLEDMKDRLPDCHPSREGPTLLEASHCEDSFSVVYKDIIEYAQRYESVPT
jgi:hypothetical protein